MTTPTEMQAKVDKTVTNMDRIDDFVNGGPTETVVLDGGATAPSVQKLVQEVLTIAGSPTIDGIPTLRADLNSRVKSADLSSTTTGKGASLARLEDGRNVQSAISEIDTIKRFGAVGDGASSAADTSAFAQALAESYASRQSIPQGWMSWNLLQKARIIPPGIYDAGDFSVAAGNVILVAAIPRTVVIRIPDNTYFIDNQGLSDNTYLHGISFVGGKGVFRGSRVGGNVRGFHVFEDCVFDNYTECAIQNEWNDSPYLQVHRCFFGGKSGLPTIGIAWGGYLDLCAIQNSLFLRNAYHIKLGGGFNGISGSFFVEHNDFICLLGRDSAGNILPEGQQTRTLADVWIVPAMGANGFGVNSGFGSTLSHNKFGNENQIAGNPRILWAPELQSDITAGKPRGAVMPDRTWTTSTVIGGTTYTHIFGGMKIDGNRVASVSPQTGPLMMSYVPEIRAITWRHNKFDGGQHTYGIQFMGVRTPSYVNTDWDVELGADGTSAKGSPFLERFSNYPVGPIRDPAGFTPNDPMALMPGLVSDDVNFKRICDMTLAANWSATASSTATYTNTYGAAQGIEVTLTSAVGTTSSLNSTLAVMDANRLAWCQMVLSRGSSNSLNYVYVDIYNFSSGKIAARRRIDLNAELTQVLFPFVTPDDGTATWQVRIWSDDYVAGTWTTFRVETGFVNQGKRPAQLGDVGAQATAAFNTGVLRVGSNGYLFLDQNNRLRVKVSSVSRPTSTSDGFSCVSLSGSTANRPTARTTGDTYYDTTLGVGIAWSGLQWEDANARRRTRDISSATTLTAADFGFVINCTAGAGGFTVTMPTGAILEGTTIWVRKVDSGAGSITVSGQTLSTQWKSVPFVYSATRTAWEPML